MSNCFVGQVRPSQILWTYGPGALIDLPNLSVITMNSPATVNGFFLFHSTSKIKGLRQIAVAWDFSPPKT